MRDRLMRGLLREKFIVSLKSGEAFEGVLAEADEKTLRLVSAFVVHEHGKRSIDGELFVPRGDILYLQRTGGAS